MTWGTHTVRGAYNFKGVGNPEYYLFGYVKIIYWGEIIKELKQYPETNITSIFKKIKKLMGWNLKGYNNPLDTNYHAEMDDSNFLDSEDIPKYRIMVRIINWLVILGQFDIH